LSLSRRGFLLGAGAAALSVPLAAPFIVRAESLMKVAAARQSLISASVARGIDMSAFKVGQLLTFPDRPGLEYRITSIIDRSFTFA
jgi:hypothetical protein